MILRKIALGLALVLGTGVSFAQLSGTKTINPAGTGPNNYTTFSAAINALNAQGVGSGGVTFNVSAGVTFNEDLPKLRATGTRSNQIVFRKSGTGANPVITPVTGGVTGTSSVGAKGDAVFMIVGGDFITIDGIDIQDNPLFTTNTLRYEYGFQLARRSATNGNKNVTIQNSRISLSPAHNYAIGIYLSVQDSNGTAVTVTSTGGTSDSNTFRRIYSNDNYNGIRMTGYNAPSPYTLHDKGNKIVGDSIVDFGGSSVAGYAVYTIYQSGFTVDSNYIYNSQTHTSTLYAIYLSTAVNASLNVRHNYVQMRSTASSSALYAIYVTAGSTGSNNTTRIHHNTIDQTTQSGSGSFYGFYHSATPRKLHFHNNKLTNYAKASTSGTIYGMYLTGDVQDSAFVYNNETTDNTGGSTFYPLYVGHKSTCYSDIHDNKIINNTNAGVFYGLEIVTGGKNYVYRNLICNNTTNTSSTSIMYGIYGLSGGETYIYNNSVSGLYAPTGTSPEAVRGIYLGGSTNYFVYHNTVYLNASSSSTAFGTAAVSATTTAKVDMRNNIFINRSTAGSAATAFTVAYRRANTNISTYQTSSDRNLFFAGTPGTKNLLFYDGTNAVTTINGYRSIEGLIGQDVYSVSGLPTFKNITTHPYDLRIDSLVANQAADGGWRVSSPVNIDQDMFGVSRGASKVDMGAFEGQLIRNDNTPPGIGYAALRATASTSNRGVANVVIADLSGVDVTSGKAPRLYYKKTTENNTYVGNSSSDNGWKWVEANNTSSPFNFTVDYSLLTTSVGVGDTIQYFIIAQDSLTTPNVGFNVVGSFNSVPTSVALGASNFPVTGVRQYGITTAISGTILVGAGQTYTSLTNPGGLFEDINRKVLTGNVNVRITSNITNESGQIPLLEYAEDGAGGYRVNITPDAAVMRTISGTPWRSLIKIVGADRVTIDGRFSGSGSYLTFHNRTAAANTVGIHIASKLQGGLNTANNIIIRNVVISNDTNISATYGILIGDSTVGTSSRNEGGDNIQILENRIVKSYYGIYASGKDEDIQLTNLVIERNDIGTDVNDSNQTVIFRGIYVYGAQQAKVQFNKVHGMRFRTTTTPIGIELATGTSGVLVNGNRVYNIANYANSTSTGAHGISIIGGEGNIITNNVVYDLQSGHGSTSSNTSGTYGIRITSGVDHKLYYNTVHLSGYPLNGTGTGGISAALIVTSTSVEGLDIRNNIFSNKLDRPKSTSKAYAVFFPSSYDFSLIEINRNAYFVPATNTANTSYFMGRFGTAEYLDRADWRGVTEQDVNSHPRKNEVAPFVNDSDFVIPAATITPAESQGEEIADLGLPNKDITGTNRPAGTGTAPDIGAYEFDGASGLDFTPPVIDSFKINIAGNQCNPTSRTVTAWISDNAGVDTVILNVIVDGSELPPVYMAISAGTALSGTWTGVVPAQGRNEEVQYNLIARDSSENLSPNTPDSTHTDGYLLMSFDGPAIDINAGRSVTIIASSPNAGADITWTNNGFVNDTLNTGVLTAPTWFSATVTDGICTYTDSFFVNVVTPVIPVADFYPSSNQIYISEALGLFDASTNLPDEWEWQITPSFANFINGTSATSRDPEVSFSRAGIYTITLIAKNPAGNDTIVKVNEVEVLLDYCTNFSNSGLAHFINKVQLDSIQNINSGVNSSLGYEDYAFSNPTLRTRINAGRTYRLAVATASASNGSVAAFIDYNRNGSFYDAGEKLGELNFIGNTLDTALYFTTPLSLVSGESRLRVMYIENTSNIQACSNYSSGEIEDYLIGLCEVNNDPLLTEVEICAGDSVLLNAQNAGAAFTWSTGETTQSIYAKNEGWYKVTIVGPTCDGEDSIYVKFKPGFNGVSFIQGSTFDGTFNAGTTANPDEVCSDATLSYELTPPVAYGNNGFTQTWFFYPEAVTTLNGTPATGAVQFTAPANGNNAKISFSPVAADGDSTFMISFQYFNLVSGCDSTIVRYVKVNGRPVADLGADQSTCGTTAIVLDAGNAGSTYLWSDGSNAQTLNATTSGKYWVQITNASGCVSSDTVNLTFNQPVSFDLGADQTACTGNTVTLDAGVTGVDYLWSTGATTKTINVTTGGWYKLTVTTAAGCVSEDSVQVTFNAKPVATFTATQTGGSTFSFAPTTSGMTYLWRFGNGYLSSLANPVIDFQANGTYAVSLQVTDPVTGCVDSSSQTITLTTTGVNKETTAAAMINAYPNPFTEQATVEVFLTESAKVSMIVTDITGRVISVVDATELNSGTHQFKVNADQNAAGVYLVRVRINETEKVIKLTEVK